MLESLSTPSTPIWLLAAVIGLTVILRKIRDAREECAKWLLESENFCTWKKKLDDAIAEAVANESEATRELLRSVHADLMREIGHLKETYVPRTEFERLKSRTTTIESLNAVHHGDPIPKVSDTTGIWA